VTAKILLVVVYAVALAGAAGSAWVGTGVVDVVTR